MIFHWCVTLGSKEVYEKTKRKENTSSILFAVFRSKSILYPNYFTTVFLYISKKFTLICFPPFQVFLKTSNIKYYKRKQFSRSIWNIAFYAACTLFLYMYNEWVILPQLLKNQGRYSLFYSSEDHIFYKSQQCEKFQFYSLFIITFYLHGAMLDFKESDYLESASKALFLMSLVAIDTYR